MNNLKKAFGKHLSKVRNEHHLTQDQLAEKISMSIDTVSNIERGIHGPRFNTLEKIACALNIHVKTLFEFEYQQ